MKIKYNEKEYNVTLEDNGTLDTVINVDGYQQVFSQDYVAEFRLDNGTLTAFGMRTLAIEVIEEIGG